MMFLFRGPLAPLGRSGRPERGGPDRPCYNDASSAGADGPATRTVATRRRVVGPDSDDRGSRLRDRPPGQGRRFATWQGSQKCTNLGVKLVECTGQRSLEYKLE